MNNQNTSTRIHALELGPMENFIYIIEDMQSKRAAVVDPAWDPAAIIDLVKLRELTITDILLTHSHHDHINAIDNILIHYDAKLHLTHAEAEFWGQAGTLPSLHYGGDQLTLGNTQIQVLHTPGHTPGSACYKIHDQLITGDTMFVFGCGRCDLAGGDPNQMFDTLNKMKAELPAHTQILPGHNYAVKETASMGEQLEGNPFLHCETQNDFVDFRMNLHGKVRQSPYDAVTKTCTHEWLRSQKKQ